jgi:hypothetical protein
MLLDGYHIHAMLLYLFLPCVLDLKTAVRICNDYSRIILFLQGHPEIVSQLVDLIGITSIMEVSFLYNIL